MSDRRDGREGTGGWFETTSSREVFSGRVTVRVDEIAAPDGQQLEREIVEATDSVVVVPLIDDDVVLVRQHRQATGRTVLELPAGLRDIDGETAVEVAARELAEETGLGGGRLTELGTFWSSPGWTTERFTVVLADGVRPTGMPDDFEPDGEEAHMEVVRLPFAAALRAVEDGAIVVGPSALGLLLAASRRS